ncbi:MAG: DinB family protein [Phycisphaerales bacterium]
MATTNPADVLLAIDRWATRNLLDACRSLRDEQFHAGFEIGPGSLHDTITHILGAQRGWTDVLTERPEPRVRLEQGTRSVDELVELHGAVADEFEAAARAGSPGDVLRPSRGGTTYTFTRGGILTHVTTHGVHHRAQCLNMMRAIGVVSLPMVSVVEWMMVAEPVE